MVFKLNKKCDHQGFKCSAAVTRLTNEEGAITGYAADVKITCIRCGTHMLFIGTPTGWSAARPMASFDRREIRLPIVPESSTGAPV